MTHHPPRPLVDLPPAADADHWQALARVIVTAAHPVIIWQRTTLPPAHPYRLALDCIVSYLRRRYLDR